MAILFSYHPDKIYWQAGKALEEHQTLIDLYFFDLRRDQVLWKCKMIFKKCIYKSGLVLIWCLFVYLFIYLWEGVFYL